MFTPFFIMAKRKTKKSTAGNSKVKKQKSIYDTNAQPLNPQPPVSTSLSKKKEQTDELHRYRHKFLEAIRGDKPRRKDQEEADKFYDGEQWTEEEKNVLESRNQPVVVVNRIKPKVDSIVGMELKLPVDTKAFPRGILDQGGAEHISEGFRYIEHRTKFDSEESRAFKDILVGGRGWYKVGIEWDGVEPEIFTRRVEDKSIYLDPYSKEDDLSDAKYLHEAVWMDLEDAKALWPTFSEKLEESLISSQPDELISESRAKEYNPDQYRQPGDLVAPQDLGEFVDSKRKRVRVVSSWCRIPQKKNFLVGGGVPDGFFEISNLDAKSVDVLKKTYPEANDYSEITYSLNLITFVWNTILEVKENVKPWDPKAKFDHVKVKAYSKRHGKNTGHDYGIVKQMIDAQKEINKRRSKMLHLLNTDRVMYESGAFTSPERARKEWAKPDAWLEHNPQFKVEAVNNVNIAQSQFQLLQESKAELDGTGVRGEIEGISLAKSGRDFKLRHEASTQSISEVFENLRGARRRVASLWLDYMQRYWTHEKVIKVTDDPNAPSLVLNQRVIDPNTGQELIINPVFGKYDIIIEEAPESLNLLSEEFEKIMKMAEIGIPIPPDLVIEASQLPQRHKQSILNKMQQQAEQQAQLAQMQAQGQLPSPEQK